MNAASAASGSVGQKVDLYVAIATADNSYLVRFGFPRGLYWYTQETTFWRSE